MTQPEELSQALKAARGLNKHSIVEVMTSHHDNVTQHRDIQDKVKQAVLRALENHSAHDKGSKVFPSSSLSVPTRNS